MKRCFLASAPRWAERLEACQLSSDRAPLAHPSTMGVEASSSACRPACCTPSCRFGRSSPWLPSNALCPQSVPHLQLVCRGGVEVDMLNNARLFNYGGVMPRGESDVKVGAGPAGYGATCFHLPLLPALHGCFNLMLPQLRWWAHRAIYTIRPSRTPCWRAMHHG